MIKKLKITKELGNYSLHMEGSPVGYSELQPMRIVEYKLREKQCEIIDIVNSLLYFSKSGDVDILTVMGKTFYKDPTASNQSNTEEERVDCSIFYYSDGLVKCFTHTKISDVITHLQKSTASDLTDGEEQVGRTIETCYGIDCPGCSYCEPTTESVSSPIENSKTLKGKTRFGGKEYDTLVKDTRYDFTVTPDPYEECAKEIDYDGIADEIRSIVLEKGTAKAHIEEILKKHFPPLSLT